MKDKTGDYEYILECKDLSKSFGGTHALDGVQFMVKPGEVHALLGENGAGKSTLMKIIIGLQNADKGKITFEGKPYSVSGPAEAIAAGIREKDGEVTVKIFNCANTDKNDLITEIFKSKMVVMGSSTINRGILSALAAILEITKGLGFKGKKAAAFGSYGWSGESAQIISEALSVSGFEVVNGGLKLLWKPDEEGIGKCRAFGSELASAR
jgi:flavorubredoxin